MAQPSCNALPGPPNFASPNNDDCLVQDIDGANALLDEGGYLDTDGDGVRETPDGVPLKILYQTSTNSVRQKTQALVQQWWKQIGVETELKNVDASVFFGGDPASPDTYRQVLRRRGDVHQQPGQPGPTAIHGQLGLQGRQRRLSDHATGKQLGRRRL